MIFILGRGNTSSLPKNRGFSNGRSAGMHGELHIRCEIILLLISESIVKEGRAGEAADLYLTAKYFLAERISVSPFFGNLIS